MPEKSEKVPKNNLKRPKSAEKCQKAGFHSNGATIRTRRESRCLHYAGFFLKSLLPFTKMKSQIKSIQQQKP